MRATMTSEPRNPVAVYCELWLASGQSPIDFALGARFERRELCLAVMDTIGSWPSSEPELAALQRVWHYRFHS